MTIPITDEMIERAARAICDHFGAANPDMMVTDPSDPLPRKPMPYWHGYRAGARAALEAALKGSNVLAHFGVKGATDGF